VQVDPIKPKLKPPGTKRLNVKYDILLSSSAFKFNLRRYKEGAEQRRVLQPEHPGGSAQGKVVHVDPMKPKLKPPGTKRLKLEHFTLLSTFAVKLNLRRYIKEVNIVDTPGTNVILVERCRSTLSNPP
jgi:hypothetical protein